VVDTTIAGTLSVAGVGSQSILYGAQVNNVQELDVATVDGRIVRCSRDENADLFDAVRGGLGQCGVILRAVYPLRPCKSKVRSYFLTYRSARAWVNDVCRLQASPRAELTLGFLAPGGDRGWMALLMLGKELDREEEVDDAAVRADLCNDGELDARVTPLWNESGVPGHSFFRVHAEAPSVHAGGRPLLVHPWVDHLFSVEAGTEMLERLLANPPPALRMGTCGLIPVARAGNVAPLLACPPGAGLMIGLGVFPKVPAFLRAEATSVMSEYSRIGCEAGGKRYLSGYVDFSREAEWADHFGPAWPWFREQKLGLDPQGILNPGFLTWR
jgi:cytokinin dehydrogenase